MIGPRKVDKPLVLYGYGKLGKLAEEIFKELGIPLRVVDKYITHVTGKTPIFHPDTVSIQERKNSLLAICVATEPYASVTTPLIAAGWTDIVPVWDIIEAYPEIGIRNGWFLENMTGEDMFEMLCLDRAWEDDKSRLHYITFWYWHKYRIEFNLVIDCTSYSPLPSTLADIRARQQFDDYWDSWFKHNDSIDIHNEGHELETIIHNMPRFQKYRPKISVACYHSRDGLWKIPKFLMDNLPNYSFTFRLHAYMGQGAYIYCIPNERKAE